MGNIRRSRSFFDQSLASGHLCATLKTPVDKCHLQRLLTWPCWEQGHCPFGEGSEPGGEGCDKVERVVHLVLGERTRYCINEDQEP